MIKASTASDAKRYPELDVLRGFAVFLMVLYHLCFDLEYLYGFELAMDGTAARAGARVIASLFLLLVGVGSAISWYRTAPKKRLRKAAQRGAIILAGAALVSLATWLLIPHAFIRFGILHLIGVSALLQPLFARLGIGNVIIGIALILSSFWLPPMFPSQSFTSVDYYPLFPWFGVILLGMGIGNWLYVPNRRLSINWLQNLKHPELLRLAGQRALLIYLVHQPILLLLLSLLLGLPKGN